MNWRPALLVQAVALTGLLCATGQSCQAAHGQAGALKLSIIAPEPGTVGDRLPLDVSYRGGAVDTVELYMDGALVAKRQLAGSQTHGVITFMLDTVLLTEGTHEVQIKAFGFDGRAVVAPASIRIPGPDLSAPVRIAYPANGIEVSGVVPIRVRVDADLQRQKPYVTFFINRELKVLRNYPPYEYNWDTTKYVNGWHVLEAWTQSPEMVAPYKSRPVHVNVNNGGGMTKKQDAVEDLRPKAPVGPPDPTRSIVLAPTPNDGSGTAGAQPAASARTATPVGATRSAQPPALTRAAHSLPTVPSPVVTPSSERLPRVSSQMSGAVAARPSGQPVKPVLPRTEVGAPAVAVAARPVAPSPVPAAPPAIKVRPGETLAAVARKTGASTADIAKLNGLPAGAKLPTATSLIVPQIGSFDVAFDGTPIAFDVTPRVEGGMGLAPFRQVFEHTGGRLYWYGGKAQAVRAVNDSREIELRIGKDKATVNNRPMKLDRKPYVDSGRTIVPLTFIRDALDVTIQYNPTTGTMLIRSK